VALTLFIVILVSELAPTVSQSLGL
jgi:hypothetical protein